MAEEQYIYAVARIRAKELELLDKGFIEQLVAARSHDEAMKLLRERGWGVSGDELWEELPSAELEKIWSLMRELVEDMSIFDALLYENDFHNLKAAIKQVYIDKEVPDVFISRGTVDPQLISAAVAEHNFYILPEQMIGCAQEAYEIQMHAGDSQLADAIIDRAALDAIYGKGVESGNDVLREYAELRVALSDISIAVRGHETKRDREFFDRAIADCNTLDKKRLTEGALEGLHAICEYLETSVYSDAAAALKTSTAAFEAWGDSLIIERMKCQKYNPFTVAPLIAYILARENEIKSVKLVLQGKLFDLSEKAIRERMREMYV